MLRCHIRGRDGDPKADTLRIHPAPGPQPSVQTLESDAERRIAAALARCLQSGGKAHAAVMNTRPIPPGTDPLPFEPELPACDPSRKFVRVTERRPDGLVAFEFSIGWPELAVELMLPSAAFDEFCTRNAVQLLDS